MVNNFDKLFEFFPYILCDMPNEERRIKETIVRTNDGLYRTMQAEGTVVEPSGNVFRYAMLSEISFSSIDRIVQYEKLNPAMLLSLS